MVRKTTPTNPKRPKHEAQEKAVTTLACCGAGGAPQHAALAALRRVFLHVLQFHIRFTVNAALSRRIPFSELSFLMFLLKCKIRTEKDFCGLFPYIPRKLKQ